MNGKDVIDQEDDSTFEIQISGDGALVDALRAMIKGRDNIILDAILFKIGPNWAMNDLVERCSIVTCHNNKIETFVVDGIALVEFLPHETVMLANNVTVTQKYRKLYSIKRVH
jgi:hypothetical protein